jgi:hypothetical protein
MDAFSAGPGDVPIGPQDWDVSDGQGHADTIHGWLIGKGSSRKPWHRGHAEGSHARGCGACRWTELHVYMEDVRTGAVPRYLVAKHGMSAVPGETTRTSWTWARGPYEALSGVYSRFDPPGGGVGDMVITRPALAAMSQAAAFDTGIRDAMTRRDLG